LGVALGRIGQRHRGDRVVDGEPYAVLVEYGVKILVERSHGLPPMGAVGSDAYLVKGTRNTPK
jgi:hypothetical protein